MYPVAVKTGAPHASQVADRFHLLMNLGEEIKTIFQSKGKELRDIFTLYKDPKRETSKPVETEQLVQAMSETTEPNISIANISIDRQHKFNKVKELYSNDVAIKQIARTTKLVQGTVRNYIATEQLSKR